MELQDSRKRNMERRRETSRFAARDRRAKESDIYDDLKDVVPVVEEPTVTHVDRIALLRVAATVCRYRKNVGNALTLAPDSARLLRRSFQREIQGESPWSEDSITECLDGFILIADSDGVILYVTESVSLFLGLTQTDFAGRHLKDFIAQEDWKDYLACTQELTAAGEDLEISRPCVLRIKTVISPRGRNLNLKSAILKPVAFNIRVLVSAAGHCHLLQAITIPAGQGTASSSANAITKQGESPSGAFMTRHTCDMRLSYVSEQLYGLLKTDSRSLMGASYYELVHPADAERLRASIQELLQKGHTRTPYYRLITGHGTVAWIMTEANTVSHTTRGQKGQYVICIHHMLGQQSEEECDRGAVHGISAGLAVRIKQEPDDREYMARQPEILECINFPSLLDDPGEFQPVPQKNRRGGAFGNLTNGFNAEHNDAAQTKKKRAHSIAMSDEDMLSVRMEEVQVASKEVAPPPVKKTRADRSPSCCRHCCCREAANDGEDCHQRRESRASTRCCSGFFVANARELERRKERAERRERQERDGWREEKEEEEEEKDGPEYSLTLPVVRASHSLVLHTDERRSGRLRLLESEEESSGSSDEESEEEEACCKARLCSRSSSPTSDARTPFPLRRMHCRRRSRVLATSPRPRSPQDPVPERQALVPIRISQMPRTGSAHYDPRNFAAAAPMRMDGSFPAFQRQILSHCPTVQDEVTHAGTPRAKMCSPLCLLPVFQRPSLSSTAAVAPRE